MKLEADDIKFTRKICVATIGDVIDSRILITFDGFDDASNYWTDITAPYIHPVNWHDENGYSITSPPGKCQSSRSLLSKIGTNLVDFRRDQISDGVQNNFSGVNNYYFFVQVGNSKPSIGKHICE